MAGLPLGSWVLIAASVGIGIALEWAFLRARRGDRGGPASDREGPR